jgi:hypothetical protein
MILELTGVLEDGSVRGSRTPLNPRKTLDIPQGGSVTLRLRVVYADGTSVVGGTVKWTLKKKSSDAPLLVKTATLAYSTDLTLVPADTKNWEPGYYVYDIWHQAAESGLGLNDGARNDVVPLSALHLEPVATLP